MKKILAIILLFATALSLYACGANLSFVEMDPVKVTGIYFTAAPDAEIDEDTFIECYNSSDIKSKAKEDDKSNTDVITVTIAGNDVFTIYYLGDDKFAVTGSAVKTGYIIDAPELSQFYDDIIDPKAEFVSVNADEIASATYTAYPSVEADCSAIADAYNNAKFIGKADGERVSDTIVLFFENGTDTLTISLIEGDQFLVSGTLVKLDYIIESADLAELYSAATK